MSSHSLQPPSTAVILTTNPETDCSPSALADFLDEVVAGAEPELDSIDAARAIRGLRDNVTG